jgi:hypothetical protein
MMAVLYRFSWQRSSERDDLAEVEGVKRVAKSLMSRQVMMMMIEMIGMR